jgi:hypothetical protein
MLDGYLTLGDARFVIGFAEGDGGFAQEALAALSEALPSIAGSFGLREPLERVRVVLVPHRGEFDRLVRDLLRVEIEVPSHPARIAQAQRADMVVLSPSAYEADSTFRYVPDEFQRLLVHEFVHIVEEHLAPDIEAVPRWWSEGLAVYLAQQWRYEDGFRRVALDAVAQNRIPSFREIESERESAYNWGWTIVRFIDRVHGKDMIPRMVKESMNGDVLAVTGEEVGSLEGSWREWLLAGGGLTSHGI